MTMILSGKDNVIYKKTDSNMRNGLSFSAFLLTCIIEFKYRLQSFVQP